MEGYLAIGSAGKSNVNDLIDIDLKCFENSWTSERWSEITESKDYGIVLAKFHGLPVGMAVYIGDPESNDLNLLKLCVKKQKRNERVSARLMTEVFSHAESKRLRNVYMIVPEGMLYGPGKISGYLGHMGFVATIPFLKKHFYLSGEYEDGVKFVASASTKIRE